MGLGLALDELVGRFVPKADGAVLVVEDKITAVGAGKQDGMAVAIGFLDDGDHQGARIPAGIDQVAALGQGEIFAIAEAVELAKELSTDDSASFINGVLSAIA